VESSLHLIVDNITGCSPIVDCNGCYRLVTGRVLGVSVYFTVSD